MPQHTGFPTPPPTLEGQDRTTASGPQDGTRSSASPSDESSTRIRVEGLVKSFKRRGGGHVPAIDDVNMDIAAGEFLVLLGPSGCGKTTLLRCLAGLESPDGGEIDICGTNVYSSRRGRNLAPEIRPISMMFQSYALWPHMTGFENVAFPMRSRQKEKLSRKRILESVHEVLDVVGVGELTEQYPGQMSGGQQQRVALARALVGGEDVILFDEPLSNVDAKIRDQLRIELLSMQRRFGFTAVYVTHDQHEAMTLGTRIAVLNLGKVEQIGTPAEIYGYPATPYVARFVGTTNELKGSRLGIGDEPRFSTEIGEIHSRAAAEEAREYLLFSRPERWRLSESEPPGPNRWRGVVELAMYCGTRTEYVVVVGDERLIIWDQSGAPVEPGTEIWASIAPDDVHVLPSDREGGEGT